MKQWLKITLGMTFLTQIAFAGGDNRVTMTDMKDALGTLIDKSEAYDRDIKLLNKRVSSVEPAVLLADKNALEIRNMKSRLNELGVNTDPYSNSLMWNEIRKFINSNKTQLPNGASN
ncbi:MAG: hypothetical protein PHE67_00800 [Campylobacterales bacterium]|nr:hypothetical protein [Campylobacterales bacterium]